MSIAESAMNITENISEGITEVLLHDKDMITSVTVTSLVMGVTFAIVTDVPVTLAILVIAIVDILIHIIVGGILRAIKNARES